MVWFTLISAALAGSTAGMGITPLGGGWAGISERGALGLGHTPTAALAERPELALDMGLSTWRIQAHLTDQAPETATGLSPIPYFGLAVPIPDFGIGDFGIGLTGMVPFGGGGAFPTDGAQRFHAIEAKVFMMEADLALAYAPVDFLRLGVAGRFARGTMLKSYAVDSAGLLNGRLAPEPAVEAGVELLEGEQQLDLSGGGFGYALGVTALLPGAIELSVAYRSPVAIVLSGPAVVTPSHDLDLKLHGTAEVTMVYPRELALGVAMQLSKVRLMADGGWTGWSTMERVDGALNDITVKGDDKALNALVESTGLNQSETTESIELYNDLGNHDVFYGGAAADVSVHKKWKLRGGLWYAPTTIPDETFHLGIVDFPAWDLRTAVAFTPIEHLTIGASLDVYLIASRDIRNSALSLNQTPESGRVLPSANGDYAMRAARMGLTLVTRL
jgi:long-subunit fatty acid transport protein